MFHHLHVLSLNPALPEQSSAGTREAVFPTPPARAGSFTLSVKARRTGCCSQLGCAMPPACLPPSSLKITTPYLKGDLSSCMSLLLSSWKSLGERDRGDPEGCLDQQGSDEVFDHGKQPWYTLMPPRCDTYRFLLRFLREVSSPSSQLHSGSAPLSWGGTDKQHLHHHASACPQWHSKGHQASL